MLGFSERDLGQIHRGSPGEASDSPLTGWSLRLWSGAFSWMDWRAFLMENHGFMGWFMFFNLFRCCAILSWHSPLPLCESRHATARLRRQRTFRTKSRRAQSQDWMTRCFLDFLSASFEDVQSPSTHWRTKEQGTSCEGLRRSVEP